MMAMNARSRRIRTITTYWPLSKSPNWPLGESPKFKPDDNVQLHILTRDEPWEGEGKRVVFDRSAGVVRVVIDTEVGPDCDEDHYLRDGRFVADEHLKAHFLREGKQITILA
jgi:hypothetical protein